MHRKPLIYFEPKIEGIKKIKVLTYVRDNALQYVAIHVNETNKSVRVRTTEYEFDIF